MGDTACAGVWGAPNLCGSKAFVVWLVACGFAGLWGVVVVVLIWGGVVGGEEWLC